MKPSGQGEQRGYRRLMAFQVAHELVMATYDISAQFPQSERYALTSQMRRAAVSVTANIVEGYSLSTTALFIHHLAISYGSRKELEYFFDLAADPVYMAGSKLEQARQLCGRTAYLITALSKSLKKKASRDRRAVQPGDRESGESLHALHALPSGEEDAL